jgi:hypothetical protein
MSWLEFDNGNTIGQQGESGGVIVFDREHKQGARFTVEKGGTVYPKLFAIRGEIYGYFRQFFYASTETQAKECIEKLKSEYENVLKLIPPANKRNYENMSKVWVATYVLGQKSDEITLNVRYS